MRKYLAIFVLIFSMSIVYAGDHVEKPFHRMTHQEIDSVIREFSKMESKPSEKISYISKYFLGMPYDLTCVGDGPYAIYEAWPLVNFKETNCMAYCEHVLALSISDNWDNFFNNLQQIRYKDGMIGMKTRNHYTMADWLPENDWILEDVSAKVGGTFTKQVTRTISHKTFFAGKGISDTNYVLPDRTITLDYVPLAALDDVKKNAKTGDIIALLFAKLDNIFSAHMLMIVEKDGQKIIRESSNSKMTTFDTSYDEWVKDKQENWSHRYIGLTFMRVKESIDISGKIILPEQISELKKN